MGQRPEQLPLSLSLLFRLGMRSAPPHARPTNVTVAFISNLLTNQIWPLHKNAPRGFTRVLGSRWNRRSQNICEGHGEERRPRARGSTSVWDNWGSNKKITPGPQFRNPSLPQHTQTKVKLWESFVHTSHLLNYHSANISDTRKFLTPPKKFLGNAVNVF